jgi:IclR family pca regulon transcriptional regulator
VTRKALTPHTKPDMAAILDEVRWVRRHGYSMNDQELELGLRSIAVPVRNSSGALIAAISLSVSASRMSSDEVIKKLLPELEAARRTFELQS